MLVKVHYSTLSQKRALKLPIIHSVQLNLMQVSLTFQIIVYLYWLKCSVPNASSLLLCASQILLASQKVHPRAKVWVINSLAISAKQMRQHKLFVVSMTLTSLTFLALLIQFATLKSLILSSAQLTLNPQKNENNVLKKLLNLATKMHVLNYHYQNASSKVLAKRNLFVHKVLKKKNWK